MSHSRALLIAWNVGAIGSLGFMPYAGLLLADSGLSHAGVAASLIVVPTALLIGGPAWSWVADRTGRPEVVLRIATLVSASAMAGLLLTRDPALRALCLALFGLGRAPQGPIGDALVLAGLGKRRASYGQVRLWGSVAFFGVAAAGGWARDAWPEAPVALALAMALVAAVVPWLLDTGGANPARPRPWRLLRDPVVLLLAATALLHGVGLTTYDSLFAVHVEALGLPSWVVGASVATGVAAEVLFMALSRPILHRIGPSWVLLMATAANAPRWWLNGTVETAGAFIATQALHGLGFGAFWVASVLLLSERAPPGTESSAQSLIPAAAFGAGYLISMGIASQVLQTHDTAALFRAMTWVAALATVLAGVAALMAKRQA